jgi:hypothetical protein
VAVRDWTREPEPVRAPGPDVRTETTTWRRGSGGDRWVGVAAGRRGSGGGLEVVWRSCVACFDLARHVGGRDMDVSCEPRMYKSQAATILTSSFR